MRKAHLFEEERHRRLEVENAALKAKQTFIR
jgi:hypothetical protein